ncbi:signal peptidase [Chryseobacterium aquaticum]|uniref:signal peptidase n=1 Tax=Chryseobacterium aquaticum TaxID=452084 RepID=UPI003F701611
MRNKILHLATSFFCLLLKAELPPQPGGQGGNGYGNQASPIDMYVYVLGIVAILIIAYFAKKYKTQKI